DRRPNRPTEPLATPTTRRARLASFGSCAAEPTFLPCFARAHATPAAYHLPFALHLDGALDLPALQAAVVDVLDRHETLRTLFRLELDGPVQDVLPLDRAVTGLALEPEAADGDVEALITEWAAEPFDLTAQIPFRVRLLRLADDKHVLAVVAHHIALDGASFVPLNRRRRHRLPRPHGRGRRPRGRRCRCTTGTTRSGISIASRVRQRPTLAPVARSTTGHAHSTVSPTPRAAHRPSPQRWLRSRCGRGLHGAGRAVAAL
ncbi:hypothetical protein NJ76_15765, partial [Rhodococcus sp. IITR03]